MEGRIHRSMTTQFVTALVILSSGFSSASSEKLELTYYVHDNFVPPDVTAVQVASANGTFTNTQFGDITVFDSVLRMGIERDSPVIGSASGEVATLRNGLSFITLVQELTVPHYSGTLTSSARANFSAPSYEAGISTGTRSFRGASGYFTVTFVDRNPLGFIIKYRATIFIPKFQN